MERVVNFLKVSRDILFGNNGRRPAKGKTFGTAHIFVRKTVYSDRKGERCFKTDSCKSKGGNLCI